MWFPSSDGLGGSGDFVRLVFVYPKMVQAKGLNSFELLIIMLMITTIHIDLIKSLSTWICAYKFI